MVGDEIDWNHVDDHVDEEIAEFLNLKNPKSFFYMQELALVKLAHL